MLSDTEFFITQAFKPDFRENFRKISDEELYKMSILVEKNREEPQCVRLLKKEREEFDIANQLDETRTEISKRLEGLMEKKRQFEERQTVLSRVVHENEPRIRETDKKIDMAKVRLSSEELEIRQRNTQIRELRYRLHQLKEELQLRKRESERYEPFKQFVQSVADFAGDEFSHDADAVIARMRRLQRGYSELSTFLGKTTSEIDSKKVEYHSFVTKKHSRSLLLALKKNELMVEVEQSRAKRISLQNALINAVQNEQREASLFGRLVLAIDALKKRTMSYSRSKISNKLNPTGVGSRTGPDAINSIESALEDDAKPTGSNVSLVLKSSNNPDSQIEDESDSQSNPLATKVMFPILDASAPDADANSLRMETGSAPPTDQSQALLQTSNNKLGLPVNYSPTVGFSPTFNLSQEAEENGMVVDVDVLSPLRSGKALLEALNKGLPLTIPALPSNSQSSNIDNSKKSIINQQDIDGGNPNSPRNGGGKRQMAAFEREVFKLQADKNRAVKNLEILKQRILDLGELTTAIKFDKALIKYFGEDYATNLHIYPMAVEIIREITADPSKVNTLTMPTSKTSTGYIGLSPSGKGTVVDRNGKKVQKGEIFPNSGIAIYTNSPSRQMFNTTVTSLTLTEEGPSDEVAILDYQNYMKKSKSQRDLMSKLESANIGNSSGPLQTQLSGKDSGVLSTLRDGLRNSKINRMLPDSPHRDEKLISPVRRPISGEIPPK